MNNPWLDKKLEEEMKRLWEMEEKWNERRKRELEGDLLAPKPIFDPVNYGTVVIDTEKEHDPRLQRQEESPEEVEAPQGQAEADPPDPKVLIHPHLKCPMCNKPETINEELEVLISCMRTSAQETLQSLHFKGYGIAKVG